LPRAGAKRVILARMRRIVAPRRGACLRQECRRRGKSRSAGPRLRATGSRRRKSVAGRAMRATGRASWQKPLQERAVRATGRRHGKSHCGVTGVAGNSKRRRCAPAGSYKSVAVGTHPATIWAEQCLVRNRGSRTVASQDAAVCFCLARDKARLASPRWRRWRVAPDEGSRARTDWLSCGTDAVQSLRTLTVLWERFALGLQRNSTAGTHRAVTFRDSRHCMHTGGLHKCGHARANAASR
jgi:hypothetical protein